MEEFASPASFFHPFQHFKITAALNETDNTIELTIPDDAPKTEWQMLESNTFALQPQQLYYMSTFVQDIDLTQISLRFRIGFYTAGGNRLDTAYAIMENTLPSPPTLQFSNTILTPENTATATINFESKIQPKVRYSHFTGLEITVHGKYRPAQLSHVYFANRTYRR